MTAVIHPTAWVEDGVEIGDGTRVWSHVHIRAPARLGRDCIVGEKSYIAYGVEVGDRVKINAFVYLCTGVSLGDGVMVAAGVVFTNDRFPRATTPELDRLRPSEPGPDTLHTRVLGGATLGARATIGPGLTIGRFAMVGMGSVVTRDVADFHLVVGQPARPVAFVCRCGPPLARFPPGRPLDAAVLGCRECGRRYRIDAGVVSELPVSQLPVSELPGAED